jgi:signal peptidase II
MMPSVRPPMPLNPDASLAEAEARRRYAPLLLGGVLAAIIIVVDRIIKVALVERFVQAGEPWPVEITSFFNLVMVWNRGISFGLFQSDETGRWILVGLATAVSVALLVWLTRATSLWIATAVGLVLGGAIGNAWDRFVWGAVADFFDVHAFGYHFWAFNVADMGISVGVTMLVLDGLFARGRGA